MLSPMTNQKPQIMSGTNIKSSIRKAALLIAIVTIGSIQFGYAQKNNRTVVKKTTVTILHHPKTKPLKTVRALPKNSLIIHHKSLPYHYSDGNFYRYTAGTYLLTAAPIGLTLSALPNRSQRIAYAGKVYYFRQETYYLKTKRGYEVVHAPRGLVNPYIPILPSSQTRAR